MAKSCLRLSYIGVLVGLLLACGIIDISASECGTTDFTRRLISKGTATERGEFPFLAAVYLVKQMEFICGGSLISAKHVLTAAHCTDDYGINFRPADVIVFLGAYNLTSRNETGVVRRDVIDIHCHPDWDAYSKKYDADVAILVLLEIVLFTQYIRPVCMPPDDSVVAGVNGTIVGWGLTENGTQSHLQYPKQGVTNALNDTYCYTTDYIIASISSLRTFCGSGGYSSPNRGDSGGGFFVRYGSAWAQFGIVSAIRANATGFVDPNSISVFTIVREFKTWINDTVRLSGGEVGEAVVMKKIQIQLNCHYGYVYDLYQRFYSCRAYDLDIRMENIEVVLFSGSHVDGKTDENVELLEFRNGTMFYLPDGVGNVFKNLKILNVRYTGYIEIWTERPNLNLKLIRRSSFKNMKSLRKLDLGGNDIVSIEEDSLCDLRNLKEFIMSDNKIESIPANLFKNNLKLEQIWITRNRLQTPDEQTFSNNLKLHIINLDSNQLDSIPVNLFENNLELREISIYKNRLKTIGVDFTVFQELQRIDLRNNLCIDTGFSSFAYDDIYKFQQTVRVNCSSAKP